MYPHSPFPEQVTKEKCLAFLEANKGRNAKNNPNKVVGIQTYLSYVNAIVDLYNTEVLFYANIFFLFW